MLYELQREQQPLNFERLKTTYITGLNVNMMWLASTLWTFLIRNVTKSYRKSVRSLVSGDELNGLELIPVMWYR